MVVGWLSSSILYLPGTSKMPEAGCQEVSNSQPHSRISGACILFLPLGLLIALFPTTDISETMGFTNFYGHWQGCFPQDPDLPHSLSCSETHSKVAEFPVQNVLPPKLKAVYQALCFLLCGMGFQMQPSVFCMGGEGTWRPFRLSCKFAPWKGEEEEGTDFVEESTSQCSSKNVWAMPMGSPWAEVACWRYLASHRSRSALVPLSTLSLWLGAACEHVD